MSYPQPHIVVGAQWGDEGKGRMVDYFAEQADVVCRYQGGNNAGHTVINHLGEFKLHLLPSGVFDPETTNVLGAGMVIDLAGLASELDALAEKDIVPQLLISERATLVLPLHRLEDELEEARLGDQAFGSTRNGIAYAYADRYAKKALQLGALRHPDTLRQALKRWYDWKLPMLTGLYGDQNWPTFYALLADLQPLAERFGPLTTDLTAWQRQQPKHSRLLFEAQLGALRDIQQGNYPFTTSSSVLSGSAQVLSGLRFPAAPKVTAVAKAFSTCVGEGPFPTAMTDMSTLRESANEYGARTGRARDVGHFDAVATRYGVQMQNADEVALTKLDCLSGQTELMVCTAYELDGETLSDYPLTDDLYRVQPVYETWSGWTEDLQGCRSYEVLPEAAKAYIDRIEKLIECPVRYVSVGPEREQLIVRY